MKEEKILTEYGLKLHEKSLVIGPGGNISLREDDRMVIKKKGADMSLCGDEGYMRVSLGDIDKGGTGQDLSSEVWLHFECYKASERVKAVIHVHSPYMVAAAAKTDVLEDVSYEFDCILQGKIPVIGFLPPGTRQLGEAVAEAVKNGANGVLMRKHGAVSVGKDMEEAFLRILALERACIVFLNS